MSQLLGHVLAKGRQTLSSKTPGVLPPLPNYGHSLGLRPCLNPDRLSVWNPCFVWPSWGVGEVLGHVTGYLEFYVAAFRHRKQSADSLMRSAVRAGL